MFKNVEADIPKIFKNVQPQSKYSMFLLKKECNSISTQLKPWALSVRTFPLLYSMFMMIPADLVTSIAHFYSKAR